MSKKPYLTEEDKQQIVNLWMNYDCTAQAAADRLGIGYSTARKIINEYTMRGAHTPPAGMLPPAEKPERRTQINEDFDAAVDQMIAESKPQEIVQTDKPVVMTEEHTAEPVPDAVMQAVIDKIETLSAILSDNLLTIKKMQQENENLRSELAVLYGWRAEHEGAEN
jgi:transposase-like protein